VTEPGRVAVDREPIERWLWDNDRNGVHVVFRPSTAGRWSVADDPGLLEAADAARAHANQHVPAETAEAFDVSPSPAGPLVLLDPPGGEADSDAWLTRYAEHLAAAGRSGTVALADEQTDLPDWVYARGARLHAFTGLVLAEPAFGRDQPHRPLHWAVDPATTDAVCRDAVAWCDEVAAADTYLGQRRSLVRLDDPDLPRTLAATVTRVGDAGVTRVRREPPAVRGVYLGWWGQLVYQVDDDTGWESHVAALVDALTRNPGALEVAVVRYAAQPSHTWLGLDWQQPLPGLHATDVWRARSLWAERVPDAHGVQVLTDAHLARARDLSAWDVRPIGAGRHLVQARDLTPWYSSPVPEDTVLAAARADFGDLILTRDS
jgi:hypothetical protein